MNKPDSKSHLILAIDFGTQSVRALAYTNTGACVAKFQIPITAVPASGAGLDRA